MDSPRLASIGEQSKKLKISTFESPFRTGVGNAKDRVGGIDGVHYTPGSH